jgi:hypothetical protein
MKRAWNMARRVYTKSMASQGRCSPAASCEAQKLRMCRWRGRNLLVALTKGVVGKACGDGCLPHCTVPQQDYLILEQLFFVAVAVRHRRNEKKMKKRKKIQDFSVLTRSHMHRSIGYRNRNPKLLAKSAARLMY